MEMIMIMLMRMEMKMKNAGQQAAALRKFPVNKKHTRTFLVKSRDRVRMKHRTSRNLKTTNFKAAFAAVHRTVIQIVQIGTI